MTPAQLATAAEVMPYNVPQRVGMIDNAIGIAAHLDAMGYGVRLGFSRREIQITKIPMTAAGASKMRRTIRKVHK